MDLDNFEKRQAITAWRDRLQLAAWELVNESGRKARDSLNQQLKEAGIQNSIWDPSHFAWARIDMAMRELLRAALGGLLAQAAEELHALDANYAALSNMLITRIAQLIYPNTTMPDEKQDKTSSITTEHAPAKWRFSAITDFVTEKVIPQGTWGWSAKALGQLSDVADAASQKLQNNIGLHDRLRRAAAERIAQAWMCDHGDHHPWMAQLFTTIDDVTKQARSMAL